jgi:hypothetical protein
MNLENEIKKFKGMLTICCDESVCDSKYLSGFANRLIAENEELKFLLEGSTADVLASVKFLAKQRDQAIADVKMLRECLNSIASNECYMGNQETHTLAFEALLATKHYDE